MDPTNTLSSERHDVPQNLPDSAVMPVIVEEAVVRRVREHSGTVRVSKQAHHEEVVVPTESFIEVVETRRVPVNRVVEAVQEPVQQGDLLVIPVYAERMVKQLVLVEEIHVRKRREHRAQEETVSLRREVPVVERFDPVSQLWTRELEQPSSQRNSQPGSQPGSQPSSPTNQTPKDMP